jgi:hypothetical protein
MRATQVVTIKQLTTIFKNGEAANNIELCNVHEHNFDIIVQKGLYKCGDKAIYIQPDFCLPITKKDSVPTQAEMLFESFNKRLGTGGRIRAIKFNFSTDVKSDTPIYSFGVMLPVQEVVDRMQIQDIQSVDLDEVLCITKYEEPETAFSGLNDGDLPYGMYKTDETNIMNCNRMEFPITLDGTVKVDGSSITIYNRYSDENSDDYGICSRGLKKKLEQHFVSGYATSDGTLIRKHFDKERQCSGFFDEKTSLFYETPCEDWTEIKKEYDDTFVKLGKPILEKLRKYCLENNKQYALRGELYGQGLKGSGNKNNPHAKLKQGIKFYGLDDYSKGYTRKLPCSEFEQVCNELGLEYCDVVFKNVTFNSFDEIKEMCNEYFKNYMIEGIVLRTADCRFSAKFMNADYDSKK